MRRLEASVTRRHIAVAAVTAGLLPLAGLSAPAMAGSSSKTASHRPTLARAGSMARLGPLPAGVHHAARIDASLANASGTVSVMLRLAGRPAAAAFSRPR